MLYYPPSHAMAIDCIVKSKSSVPEMCQEASKSLVFDASLLQHQNSIPAEFVWPDHEKPCPNPKELPVPLVDFGGFLSGNPVAAAEASKLVGEACREHGFFLVTNHGVDSDLISNAHRYMDYFFELPLSEKQRAQRKLGEHCGYASSFTGRFSSKLPWKETLSFRFSAEKNSSHIVQEYFEKTLGDEFLPLGYVRKMSNFHFLVT